MRKIITRKNWIITLLSLSIVFQALTPSTLLALDSPVIQSEAAILIDASSGNILFEKNAYDKHSPASITKIMTALLAIENLSPTDLITFSHEAVHSINWNTSRIGIDVGEQLTTDQALHGLLLMSANEVANAIAEHISGSVEVFAELMTRRAKELGATSTNFTNPHGLDHEDHYTTAYDMALITRGIYDNDYFREIMSNLTYIIPATNITEEVRPLAQQHRLMTNNYNMYRSDVIGGKTGYTDIARHTLVTIAEQDETTLIAVILKGERDTIYSDTNALLDFGFNSYKTLDLHTTNDIIATLPLFSIKSGNLLEVGSVDIGIPENQYALVNAGVKQRELIIDISLPDHLEATVSENDSVGTITYTHYGEVVAESELIVSRIDYNPSPYLINSPNPNVKYSSFYNFTVTAPIALILILLLLFGWRILKIRRNRKNQQLKFAKSLK